jgi:hypothetical protein
MIKLSSCRLAAASPSDPSPELAMLSPAQVAETYFLESRHMLLEVAAHFDRYEAALARQNGHAGNGQPAASQSAGQGADRAAAQMARLREALEIVARSAPGSERTVALLELFARP